MTRYPACGGASRVAATVPVAYLDKWRAWESKDSAAVQESFFELCRMLVQPTTGSRPENGNPVPLAAKGRPDFEKIRIRFDDGMCFP